MAQVEMRIGRVQAPASSATLPPQTPPVMASAALVASEALEVAIPEPGCSSAS